MQSAQETPPALRFRAAPCKAARDRPPASAALKHRSKSQPVPDGLFAPTIEGSDEKLREVCYQTAHRIYGDALPEIVEKRLERELNSIIGNGYGVIYYISHLLVKRSNDKEEVQLIKDAIDFAIKIGDKVLELK